jgi:hypothetical protein
MLRLQPETTLTQLVRVLEKRQQLGCRQRLAEEAALSGFALADDPGEGDHLDPSRAALAEGTRGRVDGRAARVDVVDQADPARGHAGRGERVGDVAPAVGQ